MASIAMVLLSAAGAGSSRTGRGCDPQVGAQVGCIGTIGAGALVFSALRSGEGCSSQPVVPDEPPVVPRFIEHGVSRPIAERIVIRHTYERLLDDHWRSVSRDLLREVSRGSLDVSTLPGLSVLHPHARGGELRTYAASTPVFSTDLAAALYMSDSWAELEPADDLVWIAALRSPAFRDSLHRVARARMEATAETSLQLPDLHLALVEHGLAETDPTPRLSPDPQAVAAEVGAELGAPATWDPLHDVGLLHAYVLQDGRRAWAAPGVVLRQEVADLDRIFGLLGGGRTALEAELVAALVVAFFDDGARVLQRAATGTPPELEPPMSDDIVGTDSAMYSFWTQVPGEGARSWEITVDDAGRASVEMTRYGR